MVISTDLVDDHSSAWQECQEQRKLWGGRGHGGRGVRFTGENDDFSIVDGKTHCALIAAHDDYVK
jgi:hypothetical protein